MAVSGKAQEQAQKGIEGTVGARADRIVKSIYIVYIFITHVAPHLGSVVNYPDLTPSFHLEA